MTIKKIFVGVIVSLLLVPSLALASSPSVPTLFPVESSKLIVSGLTEEETDVVVFVDNEFIGVASVESKETGTDNFSFSLIGLLEDGDHSVKVAAKNKQTRSLSAFSQEEKFFVSEERSKKPAITIIAASEEKNVVAQEKEESDVLDMEDIEKMIESGTVTEDEENNNDKILKWNLAIFIFFLVSVIVWIIWVNKELKKEKEEQLNEEK